MVNGLDNCTLIIHNLPQVLCFDDSNTRRNLKLDTLFKRGHRDEFLGATLFEQEGGDKVKAGGWGALVTVRPFPLVLPKMALC